MFFLVEAVAVYGPAFEYKIPGLIFIYCDCLDWSLEEWREAFIYGWVQAGVQEKLDLV
jgi:hypothetical protein